MDDTGRRKYSAPFVDEQVNHDVAFIEANSPDMGTDLAVLFHVFIRRRFEEPYKDWTDIPTTWFADKSKMNQRRVLASLHRLQSWGIIYLMDTEVARKYRRSVRAKYMYHHPAHLSVEEKVVETWQDVIISHLKWKDEKQKEYDLLESEEEKKALAEEVHQANVEVQKRAEELKGSPITKEDLNSLPKKVVEEPVMERPTPVRPSPKREVHTEDRVSPPREPIACPHAEELPVTPVEVVKEVPVQLTWEEVVKKGIQDKRDWLKIMEPMTPVVREMYQKLGDKKWVEMLDKAGCLKGYPVTDEDVTVLEGCEK